ncbi:MAG: polyprenyl diphosphate synthase, partial [Eubacteriales bacterium]|nr:polyprenyl diphosphate synthase [Eubacteriales bacterium]
MLDMKSIPAHVAIIMDGNGRWAEEKSLPKLFGHNAGMKAMKEIVRRASALGMGYLTVYAFSTENWKRSEEEVSGIFKLLVKYVDKELDELNQNHVKVTILGDCSLIPSQARERIEKAVSSTADNDGLNFNIALNYGSRDE